MMMYSVMRIKTARVQTPKTKGKEYIHTHRAKITSVVVLFLVLILVSFSFFLLFLRVWCVRMCFMCGMHVNVTLCEVETYKGEQTDTHTQAHKATHKKDTRTYTHLLLLLFFLVCCSTTTGDTLLH